LVPAAEVGRIAHYLRELEDDSDVQGKGSEFLASLRASRDAAEALEKALLDKAAPDVLAADMKKLVGSCKSCHVKFRD
jgi:cytochrome c556